MYVQTCVLPLLSLVINVCVIHVPQMAPVETLKRYRDFEALRQAILTLRKSLDDATPVPSLPGKRIIGLCCAPSRRVSQSHTRSVCG